MQCVESFGWNLWHDLGEIGLNCGTIACERPQLRAHIGHFTPLNSVQQAQTLSGYFWKDYIFLTRIRQITLDSQSILNFTLKSEFNNHFLLSHPDILEQRIQKYSGRKKKKSGRNPKIQGEI